MNDKEYELVKVLDVVPLLQSVPPTKEPTDEISFSPPSSYSDEENRIVLLVQFYFKETNEKISPWICWPLKHKGTEITEKEIAFIVKGIYDEYFLKLIGHDKGIKFTVKLIFSFDEFFPSL